MTIRTTDSLVYVNTVIEVHELRKIIHARPLDRLPAPVALTHRLKRRTGRPHFGVAVHANLRSWYVCECRVLNCRVAITAINAQATHVMFVAERNRLLARYVLECLVVRSDDQIRCGYHG